MQERYKVSIRPQTIGKIEELVPNAEDASLFLEEVVSPEEKTRILLPGVEGVIRVASAHGLTLPSPRELLDSIYLLDRLGMTLVRVSQGDTENEFVLGQSFKNRTCAVDVTLHRMLGHRNKKIFDQMVRETAVHELWESLTYWESWINLQTNTDSQRRYGLATIGPVAQFEDAEQLTAADLAYGGMHALKEGYYEYLTREALSSVSSRFHGVPEHRPYQEIIKLLAQKLGGDDPLFQASFTKEGLRLLVRSLDKAFGTSQAYRKLVMAIGVDEYSRLEAEEEGKTDPGLKLTLEFITANREAKNPSSDLPPVTS